MTGKEGKHKYPRTTERRIAEGGADDNRPSATYPEREKGEGRQMAAAQCQAVCACMSDGRSEEWCV